MVNTRSTQTTGSSGLLRSGKMRLRSHDGDGANNNITPFANRKSLGSKTPEQKEKDKELRSQKLQKVHDRRLNEIKSKLHEIGNAIKDLDSIQSATEDALLTWLRGPVSVRNFLPIFEIFFYFIFFCRKS